MNEQAIEAFRAATEAVNAATEAVNAAHYAELMQKIPGYFGGMSVEMGKRYARFISTTGGQRSVLFFVDIATGDILFPAGWKGPAKGVRGNIATTVPQAGTGWLYRRR